MKITIHGSPREIAALVVAVQERRVDTKSLADSVSREMSREIAGLVERNESSCFK